MALAWGAVGDDRIDLLEAEGGLLVRVRAGVRVGVSVGVSVRVRVRVRVRV